MQILFISQQIKSDSKVLNGGNVCSKSLFDAFVYAAGADNVKLISVPEETQIYKRYISYFFLRNMYTKKQEDYIVNEINRTNWDIIVLDGSWFGRLLRNISKNGKVILFLHNVEIDYSRQRARKNWLTVFKLRSVQHNEKYAVKYADFIYTLNVRDKELLQKYYNRNTDLLLPIVIKDNYLENCIYHNRKKETDDFLLFVGSYFTPNIEGLKWFVKNVMPYVSSRLLVVGKNMERLKKIESSNVRIVGAVEDLSELYINAKAVVMPIFSGGGMKVKTAEALMYGKKVYGTDEALNGYDIDEIDCIIRCNTAADFIRNINAGEQEKKYFFPEVRAKFLEKYEQKNRNGAVKDFLNARF